MQQSLNLSSHLIITKLIQVYESNLELSSISTAKLVYRLAFIHERWHSYMNVCIAFVTAGLQQWQPALQLLAVSIKQQQWCFYGSRIKFRLAPRFTPTFHVQTLHVQNWDNQSCQLIFSGLHLLLFQVVQQHLRCGGILVIVLGLLQIFF